MAKDVILIFDIGKTNKKVLLFDDSLSLVFQEEQKFEEIKDDDGFACDDIVGIEKWMIESIQKVSKEYNIKAINFSTYGATLAYLNEKGERLTPIYNYLKTMPEGVLDNFYETYGGVEEFSRKTASPALGMLNSGLQALWLKRKKPEVFKNVKTILHFPQYLSYYLTGNITSEYTSIGCHTVLWDFDNDNYHQWISKEGISLPNPISNSTTYDVPFDEKPIKVGIGIHDSSASLVPYLRGSKDQFLLISTGTWCIFMNPFNDEPLTAEQLKKDTLCYMSVNQKQVKSSRLFLGHIHDVNVDRLAEYYKVDKSYYKKVKLNKVIITNYIKKKKTEKVFFKDVMPDDYIDKTVDLKQFGSFEEAYHQLVFDLVKLCTESIKLVTPEQDKTNNIYISGGFARNVIFVQLLASLFPDKKIYTSDIDNSTALGAALVVWEDAFGKKLPELDLGLKQYTKLGNLVNPSSFVTV